MGINHEEVAEVLGVTLKKQELEIRCDIFNYLVFRQHIIPPEILVRTTLEKYAKGVVSKRGPELVAKRILNLMGGVHSG
jgi:hypothetical protein